LGNRFLGTLREVHVLVHVLACFDSSNPVVDLEDIHLELLLADEGHVSERLKKSRLGDEERRVLEGIQECLRAGKPARAVEWSEEEKKLVRSMGLLTLKPVLYVFNVDEADWTLGRNEMIQSLKDTFDPRTSSSIFDPQKDMWTLTSAKAESEWVLLDDNERRDYLESLGVEASEIENLLAYRRLPKLIQELMDYSIAYTGPGVPLERSQTTRAHLFSRMTAHDLAGRIHGDIQKGFIRAEVIAANELLKYPSHAAAKEDGCVRLEGREYELQSEDVVLIKWK